VTISGSPDFATVTFSSVLPDTNYSVSLVTNGTDTGTATVTFGCMWHINSQTTAGFTFSCRDATAAPTTPYALINGAVIAYIAVPHM
jgi:hypothetical protein